MKNIIIKNKRRPVTPSVIKYLFHVMFFKSGPNFKALTQKLVDAHLYVFPCIYIRVGKTGSLRPRRKVIGHCM